MKYVTPNRRLAYQLVGYISFAIGFIGLILPILPTTIFWIIAAACFAKSAPTMYRRIVAWPGVGPAIEDFLEDGVIGSQGKALALSGMAVAAFLIVAAPMGAYTIAVTLFALMLAAAYVLTRPSRTATANL